LPEEPSNRNSSRFSISQPATITTVMPLMLGLRYVDMKIQLAALRRLSFSHLPH
jgi:hypothetical protein